jgi:hypothetical protein
MLASNNNPAANPLPTCIEQSGNTSLTNVPRIDLPDQFAMLFKQRIRHCATARTAKPTTARPRVLRICAAANVEQLRGARADVEELIRCLKPPYPT